MDKQIIIKELIERGTGVVVIKLETNPIDQSYRWFELEFSCGKESYEI